MVKTFVELRQEKEAMMLELSAYALTPAEHHAVRTELDAFERKTVLNYIYIDADSIRAEIHGEYNIVKDAMSKLEASGWTWNE